MAVFPDIALYCLIDIDRYFRGAYSLRDRGEIKDSIKNGRAIFETRRFENLTSHFKRNVGDANCEQFLMC
jgi:hypothetical protein